MSELYYQEKGSSVLNKFQFLFIRVNYHRDPEKKSFSHDALCIAINTNGSLKVIFLEAWHLIQYGHFHTSQNALNDPYINQFYILTLLGPKLIEFVKR